MLICELFCELFCEVRLVKCALQGQPLAVAVRVQLVGHEFDVSDLRLDTSHAEVRLLPLKIAVEAKGASGSADAARRRRLFSMLSFRARLVVRTVFLPEHRTFHVFLSSALSLRNYSQHAILVSSQRPLR